MPMSEESRSETAKWQEGRLFPGKPKSVTKDCLTDQLAFPYSKTITSELSNILQSSYVS